MALLRVTACEPEPTCGWQARLSCPSGSHLCRWNACASALPSLHLCLSIYPQLLSRYHILRNCPLTVEYILEAIGSISRYVAFNCVHSLPCSVRRASIRVSSARVTEQATGTRVPVDTPNEQTSVIGIGSIHAGLLCIQLQTDAYLNNILYE